MREHRPPVPEGRNRREVQGLHLRSLGGRRLATAGSSLYLHGLSALCLPAYAPAALLIAAVG